MVRAVIRLFLAAWVLAFAGHAASAEKRVALVIGNSNYVFAPLTNPANDADDVAAALRRLQFDVMERKELTEASLLVPANTDPWPEVLDQLNSALRGWSNYFCHGTRRAAYRAVDRYVYERVRDLPCAAA